MLVYCPVKIDVDCDEQTDVQLMIDMVHHASGSYSSAQEYPQRFDLTVDGRELVRDQYLLPALSPIVSHPECARSSLTVYIHIQPQLYHESSHNVFDGLVCYSK